MASKDIIEQVNAIERSDAQDMLKIKQLTALWFNNPLRSHADASRIVFSIEGIATRSLVAERG